jgi:protein involved in polysaccharide export with SLBB domain
MAFAIIFVSGSLHPQTVRAAEAGPSAKAQGLETYIIQTGDELDIKFFYNPDLNETIVVRPDGKISLQLIDEIHAAGLAPAELDQLLTKKYEPELKKPVITVFVKTFSPQRIFVGGEVSRQGLIDYKVGMTALQAVIEAGGFLDTAKPEWTIVLRKGHDPVSKPKQINLSQDAFGKDNGADFVLRPDDIVYVPKKWF